MAEDSRNVKELMALEAEDSTPSSRTLVERVEHKVRYVLGKLPSDATPYDFFCATALAARDLLIDRLHQTERRYRDRDVKRLYYLSLEYLVGRSLSANLYNLGIYHEAKDALQRFGVELDTVCEIEPDAALGNGGLGRLAACFLDSLACQHMPGFGYGINYEHGLFHQRLENGEQKEYPDSWRSLGTPWLIERRDEACLVPVFGRVVQKPNGGDEPRSVWTDTQVLVGVPHDMPIAGYGGETVNVLRLYSAHSLDAFDLETFQSGDYVRAYQRKLASERISKLLYPADSSDAGKELRLLQEYFFVSCALRHILTRLLDSGESIRNLPDKAAIQLNDTHPALAVAELMYLLVDFHEVPFDEAWDIARSCFAYTNHTLLPEALERWSRPLLYHVLPRHVQIIEEVNARFLEDVRRRWPDDLARHARMSIIEEGPTKQVRMANLAIIGSHSVNGVSQLHSELVKSSLVPDFATLWPQKFQNKTNGISFRRWLSLANPDLSELITSRIGPEWITETDRLRDLEPHCNDQQFLSDFRRIKLANKERLAEVVRESTGFSIDPSSLFSVQVKRIHEYKRQLLAALHTMLLYMDIVDEGVIPEVPRTVIFAGKAAPEYFMAKLVIRLINSVAKQVNEDPGTRDLLRVIFVPNYRVTLAERIIPAADLSEQISTAGTEASGTGNMKLSLNGALTIGTLDGANVEIRDAVGEDKVYIFGLRSEEIRRMRAEESYDPRRLEEQCLNVHRVLRALRQHRFCPEHPGIFDPILDNLTQHGDPYFVLADLEAYRAAQQRAADDYRDSVEWSRRAALTVSRMGRFSSDRTIREYARDIWNIEPARE